MSGLGLILSGGGARGAYEAGVLSYVLGDLCRKQERTVAFDVVAGTSVGAVNASFIAAAAEDLGRAISRLEGIWSDLQLGAVMRFGVRQAAGLHRVLLGGNRPAGVFDARPLADLVGRKVPWRKLARNLRTGRLRALTVSTTHVTTGRPVIFVDRAPGVPLPTHLPPQIVVRAAHVLPHHVLASAAIPLIFAPVKIRGELYCDGGLRLNTPMAPAIHLGADRLFVIGVAAPMAKMHERPAVAPGRSPGAPFLLGKVLNAFLLDHVNTDLVEIDSVNALLEEGTEIHGPDFIDRLNELRASRGEPSRRLIRTLAIRPSVDIGSIAGDHLRVHRLRFGRMLGRSFLSLLDMGEGADADLASYLLFDGSFARKLIEQGRADARHRRDEIADFLFPSV